MSNTVICHYRVVRGNEEAFQALLQGHWPKLKQLGFVTDTPAVHYLGEEQDNGEPVYFEIFQWTDGAMQKAHQHPAVMAIWGPMEQLCEARAGMPSLEFPHASMIKT